MVGLKLIAKELGHQREEWGLPHDIDEHGSERLMAAAATVLDGGERDNSTVPWAVDLWEKYQTDPKRQAMIAGALCASALDVLAFEIGAKQMGTHV